MHLKYAVQQYSSFTSTWVASRAVVECFMGILFKITVLLDRVNLLCSLQNAASVGTSSNIQCEFPLYVGSRSSVFFSGVFALLQAYAFLQYLKDRLTRQEFQTLFFLGVSLAAGVVFLTVIYLTYTGLYVLMHMLLPYIVSSVICLFSVLRGFFFFKSS